LFKVADFVHQGQTFLGFRGLRKATISIHFKKANCIA